MNAVEIRDLTKRYGKIKALDHLNLDVPQGQVFGFLGPNGAGKTTTTRMLAGLAYPTSGSIIILGHDIAKDSVPVKRLMGYLPDVPAFYGWMRAKEYLTFTGELFGLSGLDLKKRVNSLLDAAGLSGNNRPIETFSRGMKQRLGIAQAFINDPAILLMDEPTSALDPIGRKEVLDMIKSLSEEKTVFFSTHILADAERVCDSVAIIDRGRLVAQGGLQELKDKYVKPVFTVEVDANAELLANKLKSIPWITSVDTDKNTVSINVSDVKAAQVEIAGIIADTGLPLRRLDLKETTLEDIFVNLVQGESR
ncbi:MAG: ABC transporter ATP-binding protein [Firmicutes bacterium]|nr:ABC transporter ATP-binding protein [Bacillota bacterium]